MVSLGLFRPDGVFLPLEDIDFSGLEEIFRERFFRMMLRREKVRPETVERMRAWEHSGFAVNFERKIAALTERDSKASSRTWSAPPFLSAGSPTVQTMAGPPIPLPPVSDSLRRGLRVRQWGEGAGEQPVAPPVDADRPPRGLRPSRG